MNTLSIKNIIKFRTKSDNGKKKFATDLKRNAEKNDQEGGGDYWITSLSAISNAYKQNDLKIIKNKIDELEEKFDNNDRKQTKDMYQRNIDILYKYEDFDFKKWQPSRKLTFLQKHKADFILKIRELSIQAIPHHVFTFKKNEINEIGAIWFIAKLGGYKKDELGMFADILYRDLKTNFSKKYIVNPQYCLAVDTVNNSTVSYLQIQNEDVPAILTSTINEIIRLM